LLAAGLLALVIVVRVPVGAFEFGNRTLAFVDTGFLDGESVAAVLY
jgi:hypothetical protein